mmetsp:Transcript_36542/g.83068  ORF Transcript_36542/g.83068 Transcript_36542/m.83068 type:complete len:468 (+) Transcript_36542:3-1406(+)
MRRAAAQLWFSAERARLPRLGIATPRAATERTQRSFLSGHGDGFYDARIQQWADKPIVRLSISRMLITGEGQVTPERLVATAQHVQRELSPRLARRLLDIETLPYIVVENPHIQRVHKLYKRAFEKLVTFPPVQNAQQDAQFVLMLKDLVQEGVQVVPWLARGVYEASMRVQSPRLNCNQFLSDMIMSRISRRVIAEQYIAMHQDRPGYVGVVCRELSPRKVLERVAPEAQAACERTYGVSPQYEVEGDVDVTFQYLPTHLEYILFELLKNAMRAVAEHHQKKGAASLPPIKVLFACGPSDLTIRISDTGGGVPREILPRVFDFGFSSLKVNAAAAQDSPGGGLGQIDRNVLETSPMAGLGFGLPVSRLYAQYFGGDVHLVSMEGYGCDVYIRLDHLGDAAEFRDYEGFEIWRSLRTDTPINLDREPARATAAAAAAASGKGAAVATWAGKGGEHAPLERMGWPAVL